MRRTIPLLLLVAGAALASHPGAADAQAANNIVFVSTRPPRLPLSSTA